MITKKELDIEIKNLVGLSDMVKAYEEIAATRIMHSRQKVLTNRNFIEELGEIFSEVVASYKDQVDKLIKAKKFRQPKDITFINKNGKTLYLLISANTGLYGNIIKKTFDLFIENSRKADADIAIVGRIGQGLWREHKLQNKYYYFDFPDQSVDENSLNKILEFIISYKKVVIFYGRFQNLVTQKATFSDISGNTFPSQEKSSNPKVKYVFEPSLEKILEFFEKQIFASIFEQTMRESQLAKIASRLTSLDTASENIMKELEDATNRKNVTTHRQINKKQLETISSRSLWGKI